MNSFKDAKRVVVKIGTTTLTHTTSLVNIRRMERLVRVLSDIKNSGKELVVVTSGSISVGVGKLGLPARPTDTPNRQAVAAVGQCELMYLYDRNFGSYNHVTGQVLLTADIVEDQERRQNVINTFDRMLAMGAVPIINENDTVAVEEIEFGDNDMLSAIVAELIHADALVLVTDIDGLYDANPHKNPEAKLIRQVDHIDDHIRCIASGTASNRGTGGMITKVDAASRATAAGVHTAIISGIDPDNLYRLFDGEPIGTYFPAEQ